MFTGIIQICGKFASLLVPGKVGIAVDGVLADVCIGESIAVNGVCLTVVSYRDSILEFDVCEETLRCTNLGVLGENSRVNIERSLRVGDSLSGHFVSGHVDCCSTLKGVSKLDQSWEMVWSKEDSISDYIVEKGSVAINGVSLTIGKVQSAAFYTYIIPHTWEFTNLSDLSVGDLVNLEVDILARYALGRGNK